MTITVEPLILSPTLDDLLTCETESDVVALLRAFDCRGRFASTSCPVAVYLRRYCDWEDPSVGTRVAYRGDGSSFVDDESLRLPAAVTEFIYNFDSAVYTDLLLEGA